MILLDTSGLLSALFPDQARHPACADVLLRSDEPLILSPFVLAELDYLIGKFAGVDIRLELLGEVARGAYQLADFRPHEVEEARRLIRQYQDLDIGLADASIVVLSKRVRSHKILTLDERHFRVLLGPGNQPFRLLPSDA